MSIFVHKIVFRDASSCILRLGAEAHGASSLTHRKNSVLRVHSRLLQPEGRAPGAAATPTRSKSNLPRLFQRGHVDPEAVADTLLQQPLRSRSMGLPYSGQEKTG